MIFFFLLSFFFYCNGDHRDLHVLTHPFPPRRSPDLTVPGILYVPKGAKKGDALPAVIHVHGGPGDESRIGYRPLQQYLANHGYVVFRSEEHTSELQSLMRISYAVFCLKKKK